MRLSSCCGLESDRPAGPIACTLAYCLLFIGLGLMPGMVGPTLPALSIASGVSSTAELAPAYLARGVSYGAGTIVMGAQMDRTGRHVHRVLAAWQCVLALAGSLLPFACNISILVILCMASHEDQPRATTLPIDADFHTRIDALRASCVAQSCLSTLLEGVSMLWEMC